MSFWDFLWFTILTFLFVAYLMILFAIMSDLFRDRATSGWVKALWIICLLVFPFVTALIYLIVRGNSMAERRGVENLRYYEAENEYIRTVAGIDSSSQIATAKRLLDNGAITDEEFKRIKEAILP
ncbi:SHOCT domain-containing protein [Nocardia altamirensis]|uniref:SHOCT domain-containing protein n=1 Tax=Nocardia altamirensis TaxID=472158 RepID=UPI00084056EF|nr:SHOCT domain-containing protein [Nocardia altamirensis]